MAPARLASRLTTALAAWLVLHELHTLVPGLDAVGGPLFGRWAHVAVMATCGALVLWRAVAARHERVAWLLLGGALLAWTGGEAYFTLNLWDLASPPVPSPADVGFLLFPALGMAGILALAGARVRGADRMMAADAATAALAAGALSAANVFGAVVDVVGGNRLSIATNLAYPVTDLLLLATVVGVCGLQGWRMGRSWMLLGLGCLSFTLADGVYLVDVAKGTWASGGPFDAGWWAAAPLWALAAWAPAQVRVARTDDGSRTKRDLLPLGFAAVAVTVLVAAALGDVNILAVVLAAAALVASIARLNLTLRAHAVSLRRVRGEALTDPLTGLGNRRLLATDLDERLAVLGGGDELMLAIFDLDGFKHHNDLFGHLAGDAALVRLASRLRDAVGLDGRAYRLGGDEFCTILTPRPEGWDARLAACAAALSEQHEGYAIGCSHGAILMPEEAAHSTDALRLADERMYASKPDGRTSAVRQATDALLMTMTERFPDLGRHSVDVAGLAASTAAVLGMAREEVEEVRRAAELHDIGKIALPESILTKPGPLDPAEWWEIRRHTIVGERIVAAAPALGRVARIVRSTHERYDGRGYPDGLAGEEIPLGARIVAVCDSFDAMTSARAYRGAMEPHAAIAELQACAGEQFDADVVTAFVAVWREAAQPRVAAA